MQHVIQAIGRYVAINLGHPPLDEAARRQLEILTPMSQMLFNRRPLLSADEVDAAGQLAAMTGLLQLPGEMFGLRVVPIDQLAGLPTQVEQYTVTATDLAYVEYQHLVESTSRTEAGGWHDLMQTLYLPGFNNLVNGELFGAFRHFEEEMFYRLLAPHFVLAACLAAYVTYGYDEDVARVAPYVRRAAQVIHVGAPEQDMFTWVVLAGPRDRR